MTTPRPRAPNYIAALMIASDIVLGGKAEAVGFKSLHGYRPAYLEIDGVTAEVPPPDLKESPGVRVRRANGEIALYVVSTMEQARTILKRAEQIVASQASGANLG